MITFRFVYSDGFEKVDTVKDNIRLSTIQGILDTYPDLIAIEIIERRPS